MPSDETDAYGGAQPSAARGAADVSTAQSADRSGADGASLAAPHGSAAAPLSAADQAAARTLAEAAVLAAGSTVASGGAGAGPAAAMLASSDTHPSGGAAGEELHSGAGGGGASSGAPDDGGGGGGDRAPPGSAAAIASWRQRRRERGKEQREREKNLIAELQAKEDELQASIASLRERARQLQHLGLFDIRAAVPTFLRDYVEAQRAFELAAEALTAALAAPEADASTLAACNVQVLKSLQTLASLRQTLIQSSLSGCLLDRSGKLSLSFERALFDAIVGEMPMATWMRAFLARHSDLLVPEKAAGFSELLGTWETYERHLEVQARESLDSAAAQSMANVAASLASRVHFEKGTFTLEPAGPRQPPSADGAGAQASGATAPVALDPFDGHAAAPQAASAVDGGAAAAAAAAAAASPTARLAAVLVSRQSFRTSVLWNLHESVPAHVCARFLLSIFALNGPLERLVAALPPPINAGACTAEATAAQ